MRFFVTIILTVLIAACGKAQSDPAGDGQFLELTDDDTEVLIQTMLDLSRGLPMYEFLNSTTLDPYDELHEVNDNTPVELSLVGPLTPPLLDFGSSTEWTCGEGQFVYSIAGASYISKQQNFSNCGLNGYLFDGRVFSGWRKNFRAIDSELTRNNDWLVSEQSVGLPATQSVSLSLSVPSFSTTDYRVSDYLLDISRNKVDYDEELDRDIFEHSMVMEFLVSGAFTQDTELQVRTLSEFSSPIDGVFTSGSLEIIAANGSSLVLSAPMQNDLHQVSYEILDSNGSTDRAGTAQVDRFPVCITREGMVAEGCTDYKAFQLR